MTLQSYHEQIADWLHNQEINYKTSALREKMKYSLLICLFFLCSCGGTHKVYKQQRCINNAQHDFNSCNSPYKLEHEVGINCLIQYNTAKANCIAAYPDARELAYQYNY